MADIWVCANCRSVNNLRSKQCYQCRTPKDRAAVDPLTIDATSHGQIREIELPPFHPSRGAAVLASLFILSVAALQVAATLLASAVLAGQLEDPPTTVVDLDTASKLGVGTLGVGVLALVTWSFWLSRVVRAMPALGLGYPAATGLTAFVENFIPFLNLLRVPAIVRDIVRRFEPREGRGDALIFAAWIGLFGGLIVPRVGGVLNAFGAETTERFVRNTIVIGSVGMGLVLVGALFLVALIWWIELRITRRRRVQQAELAQRASTITASAPTASSAPYTQTPVKAPAPPPDPLQTRSVTAATSATVLASLTPLDPGPSPTLPMDSGTDQRSRPAAGPRLTMTIDRDGLIRAELDGESEVVNQDDLQHVAEALVRAGGSAIVTASGNALTNGWTAREIADALRDSGVPTTFEE